MKAQAVQKNAIYLYMGILESYEAIAEELMGHEAIEEQILPRMVFYVKNFLPEFSGQKSDAELIENLGIFLAKMKKQILELKDLDNITMSDIWEVRAAIFGYENVFLEVLGVEVIENYVFQRMADILVLYLPESFKSSKFSLDEKLDAFSKYLRDNGFVKSSGYSLKKNKIEFRANYCAFSAIHHSRAYMDGKTRFCPWGMIANSILVAHIQQAAESIQVAFTTRGSITKLEMVGNG